MHPIPAGVLTMTALLSSLAALAVPSPAPALPEEATIFYDAVCHADRSTAEPSLLVSYSQAEDEAELYDQHYRALEGSEHFIVRSIVEVRTPLHRKGLMVFGGYVADPDEPELPIADFWVLTTEGWRVCPLSEISQNQILIMPSQRQATEQIDRIMEAAGAMLEDQLGTDANTLLQESVGALIQGLMTDAQDDKIGPSGAGSGRAPSPSRGNVPPPPGSP